MEPWSHGAMHDINIAIVNWKAKQEIDICLESLFEDIKGSGLQAVVHVVDNSQNADGIKELLKEKYPGVRYIDPGGNIGFGKAQNLAFQKEEARFYLSLNPDIEFLPGRSTIKRMLEFLHKNKKVGLVAPKLLNPDKSIQYSCCRFPGFLDQIARRLDFEKKSKYFKKRVDHYLMKDFDHEQTVPVDWVIGSFMLIKKEAADQVGFFDDRFFMYFEDCDWCRRVWEKGYQIYYIHDTSVIHAHHRDSADGSPIRSLFKNPIARVHLKSWLKYFWKWGIRRKPYGY
ncbi:MAG: glycosyltransferase family 2 protein [Patescibacteria group bacterium]